jgi:hypothetical protein
VRNSFDESRLFLEVANHHILHKLVRIPALLRSRVRQLRFDFRGRNALPWSDLLLLEYPPFV